MSYDLKSKLKGELGMRETKLEGRLVREEMKFDKGVELIVKIYSGPYNIEAEQIYTQLQKLNMDGTPVKLSHTDDDQIQLSSVEMIMREQDPMSVFHTNICEVIIKGRII